MGTKNFSNANDLITFSRASAGTALRKVAYGPELISNGEFTSDTSGWAALGATQAIVSGELEITTTNAGGGSWQLISVTPNKPHLLTLDRRVGTADIASVIVYDGGIPGSGAPSLINDTDAGTFSEAFVPTNDTVSVYLRAAALSAGTTAYYDNISVKEVLFDQGTLTLFNHPADVPRIEYDADGNVLGLLVEESRTNLVTYSEERNQWTKGTIGVTDGALSINGLSFSLLEAGLLSTSQITIGVSVSPSATVTYSDYVKAGTSLLSRHGVFDSVNSWAGYVDVGWSSGVPSTSASSGASNIEYEDIGNGVYRISFSVTINASPGGITFHTHPDRNATGLTLYVSGAQLEAGAFPTSYIPTSGSTATRAADVASIPVSAFGYNQSEGTVVVEYDAKYDSGPVRIVELEDTITDRITLYEGEDGAPAYVFVRKNNVTQATVQTANSAQVGFDKLAVSATADDTRICLNGGAVVEDTSTDMPLVATLLMGQSTAGGRLNGHIKSLRYIPRRLTNSQLVEITQ